MGVFTIKAHDTRPILEVALKDPDGTAHDLTGSTAWRVHILVSPFAVVSLDLYVQGQAVDGVLRYIFVATDWDTGVGGLPVPPAGQFIDLPMEYEVIAGTERLTFPNDGWDTLRIRRDIG